MGRVCVCIYIIYIYIYLFIYLVWMLTLAKVLVVDEVEGLHLVLSNVQVQSIPHVQGITLAGV